MDSDSEPFGFLPFHTRAAKPRSRGVTSIRGPYYTPVGRHYLSDLLAATASFVDSLKYAGGSFTFLHPDTVRALNRIAHQYEVAVSTGGFLERVVSWGETHVAPYLRACRSLDFDIVEVSSGFLELSDDQFVDLVKTVRSAGLRVVAEVGIQRAAGGSSSPEALERAGTYDPQLPIRRALRALDAGAELILIESEGITEGVRVWRTDVIELFAERLGLERVMFEAAEPAVFEWYVRTFGREVNLFVDHSQIIQLEALRLGAWGTAETW